MMSESMWLFRAIAQNNSDGFSFFDFTREGFKNCNSAAPPTPLP